MMKRVPLPHTKMMNSNLEREITINKSLKPPGLWNVLYRPVHHAVCDSLIGILTEHLRLHSEWRKDSVEIAAIKKGHPLSTASLPLTPAGGCGRRNEWSSQRQTRPHLPRRVLVYKLATMTADFPDVGYLPPGSKQWAKHMKRLLETSKYWSDLLKTAPTWQRLEFYFVL